MRNRFRTCIVAFSLAVSLTLAGLPSPFRLGPSAADETISPEELAKVKATQAARIAAVQRVFGAVVAIYGSNRQGGGSGVIFDQAGYALTNHHVIAGAGTSGWGGLADGKLYRWKLIGTDPGGDIAIIQLTGKDKFPAAPLGDSDKVRVGDWAMAMGNPFILAEDQKPTVTLGVVSGVRRYQGGAGMNTLVYGDCIQVDSSINPGNSGGPLFNIQGEIIGINGRGSFKERGRVNVGLGYAVSSNQIKYFLPDLLATKVAQHGTLDAVFGSRQGKIVCESINLDAPVADAGLKLSDRLVSFEGRPMRTVNQFTNFVSTLTADWPAQFVIERDGKQRTIVSRLVALPYQTQPPPRPRPGDRRRPRRPQVSLANPGMIRDEKKNQEICGRLLRRWRTAALHAFSQSSTTAKPAAVSMVDDCLENGAVTGRQEITAAADGRFVVRFKKDDQTHLWGFDGQRYWSQNWTGSEGSETQTLTPLKALRNAHCRQGAMMAALLEDAPLSRYGKTLLDGAGKADGRLAYRIKLLDDDEDWSYVWLSVKYQDGLPQSRLAKAGPDLDSNGPNPAVLFDDWKEVSGVMFPHRRVFVRGLAETPVFELKAKQCEVLTSAPEGDFAPPTKP